MNVLIGKLGDLSVPTINTASERASYAKEPKLRCLWSLCSLSKTHSGLLSISLRILGKLPLRTFSCVALLVPWFTFHCWWLFVVQLLPVLKLAQLLGWYTVWRNDAAVTTFGWLLGKVHVLTAYERFIDSHMDQTTFGLVFLTYPGIPPQAWILAKCLAIGI